MRIQPFTLQGRHVRLEPLSLDVADALVTAADADRSSYGFTPVPADLEAMRTYIGGLLADAQRDTVVPFVQVRVADGRPVGCTRYLNVTWWAAPREHPAEVEIGGTWLAADAQRTALNTEAKLLLLANAFEQWGVSRVAIATDARNEQSRRAILRLGASFEGILRHHRMSTGTATEPHSPRDTAMYSVLADEWPAVRAGLQARIDG